MKGFAITMKNVFQKDGQKVQDFFNELKALNDADRKWYHIELMKSGFICSEPEPLPK